MKPKKSSVGSIKKLKKRGRGSTPLRKVSATKNPEFGEQPRLEESGSASIEKPSLEKEK